jgi:hypothetical protein
MGTKNGNTGTVYTKTTSIGGSTIYPAEYALEHEPQKHGDEITTPNLRNVPWAYYTGVEQIRRGSTSSTSSTESSKST